MPNTMLHLVSVNDLVAAARKDTPVGRALHQAPWAARLGGILVDLPFFSFFTIKVALHLLRRPLPYSDWGQAFHFYRPGSLGHGLASVALRDPRFQGQAWPLALAAGHLCHMAFDREIHPQVDRWVRSQSHTGLHPDVLHGRYERYQNLFFQQDHLGRVLVGTAELARLYDFGPLAKDTSDLLRLIRGATIRTYGRCPSWLDLRLWLCGLDGYVWLLSGNGARWQGFAPGEASDPALRACYYQDEIFSMPEAYERAMARARGYLAALDELVTEGRDGGPFLEAVTDQVLG